ncbi:hypothetical protein IRT45_34935 [Nocardia sp. BSTN01]|uniref:hypothetical protein n=1 Tax=Nocardia sp. BSTN01 TaxID=2783665 RepID=UPI00188FDB7E|nr:hypothetical protein [Nocardia sp. BSTN01]MBF5002316.1 hypothetical protein [Nocardia sp. BSTN01]
MNLHRFTIDRAAQDPKPNVWHHKGRFFTLYRDDVPNDVVNLTAQVETILQKPRPEFSARFHIGNEGSETPYDGHLTILGSGIYWGLGTRGKLAARISRCAEHKWEGRDMKISIHDGKLWLAIWTHPGSWTRGEFAEWRTRSFNLNPLDHLYGEPRFHYSDTDTAELAIRMPEDTYTVKATLQLRTFGRPRARRRTEKWVVDVDAPGGIPERPDRGSYKGNRVHGFAVSLPQRRDDWQIDAQAAIEAWVLQQRAASGFRAPEAHTA